MASDPDCSVVRLFDKLFTRGLLYQQDHISELGDRLEILDQKYQQRQENGCEANNGTARDDFRDRKELVNEIFQTLSEYYKHRNLSMEPSPYFNI